MAKKIYIWDGALADYTGGMVIAIAENLKAAKDAVRKDLGNPQPGCLGYSELEQDLMETPEVVRITETMRPRAWHCYGGG